MASHAAPKRARKPLLIAIGLAVVLGAGGLGATFLVPTISNLAGSDDPAGSEPDGPAAVSPSGNTPAPLASPSPDTSPSASVAPAAKASAKAEPSATLPRTDRPVGFAAMNGGTRGGKGAAAVHTYVLSAEAGAYGGAGDALNALLEEHRGRGADEGLIVYVDTTVADTNLSQDQIDVKDLRHVSILGVGTSGELNGVGITVTRSYDVVIQNLAIHHVAAGEKDAVSITDHSTNVWIDHNELYSDLAADEDHYDGLVDVKRNSQYVTISWNYIHDHWKTSLVGHTDDPSLAPDNITYAFNHFQQVNSRVPLVRHAHVHVLNNYFDTIGSSAINARGGAQILVEGNYFYRAGSGNVDSFADQVQGPVGWWYGSDTTGYWNLRNNRFEETASAHLASTTDFTVPYTYAPLRPAVARAAVLSGAGAGVLTIKP